MLQFAHKVHQGDPVKHQHAWLFFCSFDPLQGIAGYWVKLPALQAGPCCLFYTEENVLNGASVPISLQSPLGQRWRNLSLGLTGVSAVYFLLPVPVSRDSKHRNFIISLDIFQSGTLALCLLSYVDHECLPFESAYEVLLLVCLDLYLCDLSWLLFYLKRTLTFFIKLFFL